MSEEKKSLAQLCREAEIDESTVRNRLKRGWKLDRALNTPVKNKNRENTVGKLARKYKISVHTVNDRMKTQNMTLEEALKTPLKQGYRHLWQNKKEEMIKKQNKGKAKKLKKYIAIDPEGNEIIIKNLKEFCRENNWIYNSVTTQMVRRKGKYKGWLIKVKNDD